MKWIASAVFLSIFLESYCQLWLHTLHFRVDFDFKIWYLAFLVTPVAICLSAKRRIEGSTAWSAPMRMVISEMDVRFSWSAICCAEASIASASAHSCIFIE